MSIKNLFRKKSADPPIMMPGIAEDAPAYAETANPDQGTEWAYNIDNNNDARLNAPLNENYTEEKDSLAGIRMVAKDVMNGERPVADLCFALALASEPDRLFAITALRMSDEHLAGIVEKQLQPRSKHILFDHRVAREFSSSKLGTKVTISGVDYVYYSGPSPIVLRRDSDGKEVLVR